MSRDPLLYLDDIAQAAEKIDRFVRQLTREAASQKKCFVNSNPGASVVYS